MSAYPQKAHEIAARENLQIRATGCERIQHSSRKEGLLDRLDRFQQRWWHREPKRFGGLEI